MSTLHGGIDRRGRDSAKLLRFACVILALDSIAAGCCTASIWYYSGWKSYSGDKLMTAERK